VPVRVSILAVHTQKFAGRSRLKEATRQARLNHGMTKEGVQWVWKGSIIPEEPLLDLDADAQTCVVRLRDASQQLHEPIRLALTETTDSKQVDAGREPQLDADEEDTPSTVEVDPPAL
jgi:hypothetical protein